MESVWIGKAVSIECDEALGVFQGVIKDATADKISIVRAFRNGVPLRKQDAQVTLRSQDIRNISIIPVVDTINNAIGSVVNEPKPVKYPNFPSSSNGFYLQRGPQPNQVAPKVNSLSYLNKEVAGLHISKHPNSDVVSSPAPSKSLSTVAADTNVAQFFNSMLPPKVEARLGSAFSAFSTTVADSNNSTYSVPNRTEPIDIQKPRYETYTNNSVEYSNGSGSGSGNGTRRTNGYVNNNGNSNGGNTGQNSCKKHRKQVRRENSIKQTFGTSVDDPQIHEDFDFEANLALFDKQAIWDGIESKQKNHVQNKPQKKYRHDENVLAGVPLELRQIEFSLLKGSKDFVTDDGLIIPTIPMSLRSRLEFTAAKAGLSLDRQTDNLARGATELAIVLLGGARRFLPRNSHQWPKIAIICNKTDSLSRANNIGASTGRMLSSHGVTVMLYIEKNAVSDNEQKSNEMMLYTATGNLIFYNISDISCPDLVILTTDSKSLSTEVTLWLRNTRASILCIDPPVEGVNDVDVKYSILPILPLTGISERCGKLYLCNLAIPDQFYYDVGLRYKSPFGHKFVIPIHLKN